MAQIFTLSSLEKVLIGKKPKLLEKCGSMAKNEIFSFQVAYQFDYCCARDLTITVEGPLKDFVTLYTVEYVPATTPNTWEGDGNQISTVPFLCPDVLVPCKDRHLTGRYNMLNSIWVQVQGDLPTGTFPIEFTVRSGENVLSCTYTLTVCDFTLDTREFKYTSWFHYDGISHYYNLPVFSDEYNKIMDKFIVKAVEHGMNMLLIPMFTPPLDTREGHERTTVQLIDVYLKNGDYVFDFDRLIKFMRRVDGLGIKYFEMSHLFSQWGAKFAPKIMGYKDGEYTLLFGWNNSSTEGEYPLFLSKFLPRLRQRLVDEGLFDRCYFHLSDEPNENSFENYTKIKEIFKSSIPDGNVMDALSHYDYYKLGLVDTPICGTDAIKTFIDNKVEGLWAYYCCAQCGKNLSNRIMSFPSYRTRVLGIQLYLNNICGFLQWGYNFYNAALSDYHLDPFFTTDAGGSLQSGDSYVVYPGKNGPYDSIRHEVFYDALQDMHLFYALEEKIGRDKVESLLLKHGFEKSFTEYPHSARALLKVRQEAHKLLK